MNILQLTGKQGNSRTSLSTSDLPFYDNTQGLIRPHNENNLQALLNQLVDKTNAQGGLLSYNCSGIRKFLVAGKTDKEFEITENERRLLSAGKFFMKEGTHIQPISSNRRLMGIICININWHTWRPLCKDLAYAYSQLAAKSFEIHRGQSTFSKYADPLFERKLKLEQIQEYNQNLLSITAHDLSSPLNAVSGYLEMIEEYMGNNDHANKLAHYYQRIQSGISDVSDMLAQLNEVIRLKKGFSSLTSVKIAANKAIKEMCDLLSVSAEKKEINLQFEAKKDTVYVRADVVKFKRVIYNLVSNAIKYSRKHQPIYVQTDQKNEQLYVYIKDSGTGIPEEEMDTIFDPFMKYHWEENNTTSFGLGLYIASYFTELMNGKLMAKSTPGKGSTFTVVIPLAIVPATQSKTS